MQFCKDSTQLFTWHSVIDSMETKLTSVETQAELEDSNI